MAQKKVTHLQLEDRVGRIARMRAAQLGATLTAYVAGLIEQDARQSGIDQVVASQTTTKKEVGRG